MSAKMSDERREYLKNYQKENLKRIPLDVSYDFYIKIQQTAYLNRKSINGFIKEAIAKAIEEYERGEAEANGVDEKVQSFREKLMKLNNT